MYKYQFICYIFKQFIKIIIFYTKTNNILILYGFNKLYSDYNFILKLYNFKINEKKTPN